MRCRTYGYLPGRRVLPSVRQRSVTWMDIRVNMHRARVIRQPNDNRKSNPQQSPTTPPRHSKRAVDSRPQPPFSSGSALAIRRGGDVRDAVPRRRIHCIALNYTAPCGTARRRASPHPACERTLKRDSGHSKAYQRLQVTDCVSVCFR